MIINAHGAWILATPRTTYVLRITETGHPEHLYYGPAIVDVRRAGAGNGAEAGNEAAAGNGIEAGNGTEAGNEAAAPVKGSGSSDIRAEDLISAGDILALTQKQVFPCGNLISYDEDHPAVTLENMNLEMSSAGKGDVREPFVEIVHADGSRTSDFLYDRAIVSESKLPFEMLPGSYAAERFGSGETEQTHTGVDHLALILRDKNYDLELELHYYVYEDCDVICRLSRLVNLSDDPVRIERLMSAQLDIGRADLVMTTFRGAWAREMGRHQAAVNGARVVNTSAAGTSSNRANPFVMLHPAMTTEATGLCYAANLVYSGNHYESAETGAFGTTRFLTGIAPQGFEWNLAPGDVFEAPEAVLTCTKDGFTGISLNMHAFVRKHIVRGKWADRTRPILLNSWEAAYFKISESKLLKLAKAAKSAGIELFVMDDGWFGRRDDDSHSLGDWTANTGKLPGGLKGISGKIHDMGMMFGIWIEPEMVNVESDLYRKHPDWVMQIPAVAAAPGGTAKGGPIAAPGRIVEGGPIPADPEAAASEMTWRPHSEGRHQRILDLANPEVVDYLIKEMTRVIEEASADYVKWDMNRIFSDVYSPYLAKMTGAAASSCQGETAHRYILGLYRLMKALTERFPDTLFEGCASGGNRFDLGILCYMPQIWASDNTDAISRIAIQEGYSYGYPMNTVASHVSSVPNHQTLRITPLATRFAVAAFGVCGLECNLADMPKNTCAKIAGMVGIYKVWREVLQKGNFYRQNGDLYNVGARIHEWTCVSGDKTKAVGLVLQELVTPNNPYLVYRPRGLDPEKNYRFYNRIEKHDLRRFGDLVNTVAPIHVKQDSFLHRMIARFYKMPGEKEDLVIRGSVLMEAGINLSPAFAGTGYNEEVRYFQDFSARLYFMEAE